MHDHGEQQPQHVDDNMALAAIGLLVHIHPPRFAPFGGLDTLTVDNGGTGLGLASRLLPRRLDQGGIEPRPQPALPPAPEVAIDGLPRREVPRQHPPLTPRAGHVENGIHNLPRLPICGGGPALARRERSPLCGRMCSLSSDIYSFLCLLILYISWVLCMY